ncbi:zinc finger FYVE domain-containing protein 9-like isoform X2 [Artemia franciscana]|uniref:zinc finger FYVE domain-containing protein 9-like isoform X2 n=1 Tax=Artemia franciscana TaxID=6661 RepID=UPI0032DB6CD2
MSYKIVPTQKAKPEDTNPPVILHHEDQADSHENFYKKIVAVQPDINPLADAHGRGNENLSNDESNTSGEDANLDQSKASLEISREGSIERPQVNQDASDSGIEHDLVSSNPDLDNNENAGQEGGIDRSQELETEAFQNLDRNNIVHDLVSFDEDFILPVLTERISNLDLLTDINFENAVAGQSTETNYLNSDSSAVPGDIHCETNSTIPKHEIENDQDILQDLPPDFDDTAANLNELNLDSSRDFSNKNNKLDHNMENLSNAIMEENKCGKQGLNTSKPREYTSEEPALCDSNAITSSKVKFGDFDPTVTEEDLEKLLKELESEKETSSELLNGIVDDQFKVPNENVQADTSEKQTNLQEDLSDVSTSAKAFSNVDETRPDENKPEPLLNKELDQHGYVDIQEVAREPDLEENQDQEPTHSDNSAVEAEPDVIGVSLTNVKPDVVGPKELEPDLVKNVETSVTGEQSDSSRPTDLGLVENLDVTLGSPGRTPHPQLPREVVEGELATCENIRDIESRLEPYTSLTEEERSMGIIKPFWIPDEDALNCMHCDIKFTLLKRRHHCRACGKVFCSTCCSLKTKIEYLENREERVCQPCFSTLSKVEAYKKYAMPFPSPCGERPNPNNPSEYCSTVPPLQQAAEAGPSGPPVVMVPVGVLKREGSSSKSGCEQKQVMFSDGIRPGGDLANLDEPHTTTVRPSKRSSKSKKTSGAVFKSNRGDLPPCLLPRDGVSLPPILQPSEADSGSGMKLEQVSDVASLLKRLRDEEQPPLSFLLNKNLTVSVKIVHLDCCVNKTCWSFSTKGLKTVCQDELLILIEEIADEKTFPRDIFAHISSVYEDAVKGRILRESDFVSFDRPFLSSTEIGGILYIQPTFQCVKKLSLPSCPFLFGLLVLRPEVPWAKVFPLRLVLRLGAEHRYYPCPLYSSRNRGPVYSEIRNTIVNILADLRNFSYTLPIITGLTIQVEDKQTIILIPKNHHALVVKAVNQSNENVLALGASFNSEADSHLVCIQESDGSYQTQAINIQNRPRSATGANFVVFNGALKTTSGLTGKSSIVEDGVMVQILPETMVILKNSLREMQNFQISCGSAHNNPSEDVVSLRWTDDLSHVNAGVISPIDNMSLAGKQSTKVRSGMELQCNKKAIRWNDLYIIQRDKEDSVSSPPPQLSKSCEAIANSTCSALSKHLDSLSEAGLSLMAVRLTLDSAEPEYAAGSCGEALPSAYTSDLDTNLIPVMLTESQKFEGTFVVELWFYIVNKD